MLCAPFELICEGNKANSFNVPATESDHPVESGLTQSSLYSQLAQTCKLLTLVGGVVGIQICDLTHGKWVSTNVLIVKRKFMLTTLLQR